jgi:PhzF family phenazine biosynthesis protein
MVNEDHDRSIPLYQVDAFSDEPFRGNPAAVCLLDEPLGEETMQAIAAEMNLSETAFVSPLGGGIIEDWGTLSLRWFTPKAEVPLCGHATLATAAVLFNALGCPHDVLEFRTKSGILTSRKHDSGICLDFPANRTTHVDPPQSIIDSLGLTEYADAAYAKGMKDILIRVEDPETVRSLVPDFNLMVQDTHGLDVNGVMVTAPGDPPYDFTSRFFAPWWGVDEDPVTGAAHTVLTPYWSALLDKEEMYAHQASSRGGSLVVRMAPDDRVNLIGNAVIVMRGELRI